jgi:hypothetical protein
MLMVLSYSDTLLQIAISAGNYTNKHIGCRYFNNNNNWTDWVDLA